MTTLFGWGPMFGCRSPSPFVIKTEIQLQMLGVAFDCQIADLESVPKQKAPYVRDDDGVLVEDSTFIRDHFERLQGRSLDAHLSPAQRAQSWAVERMLEDHLVPIMACERWLEGDNFERGPRGFFVGAPEEVVTAVVADLRKAMAGAGVGRFTRAERMNRAARDIAAVAELLGDKAYMFGDRPSGVDATVFGVLSACAAPVFETELRDLVARHETLTAYLARMDAEWFRVSRWPAMG